MSNIIIANDIRVGNILEFEGKLWAVHKTMHTQPGKGGAYMQVEMKDIQQGTKRNIRFRSSETITKVHLEDQEYQFLYIDGDDLALMNPETFEQIYIKTSLVDEQLPFLQEGMTIKVQFYNETAVGVSLPETVICLISECEPVVKGQTATSSYKPAVLENGVRVMVPPFVESGDKIVVKIATLEYMQRA